MMFVSMRGMPEDSKIHREMNNLIEKRRFQELVKKAEKYIDENPESYLGRWWKARALTFLGDTESALKWFVEAMKKAEDEYEESKISSSIANVYNIRKNWQQSLNYTEIALELNSENVVAIIARSIALMATGSKREALQLLEKNSKLFKNNYEKACVEAVRKNKGKMLTLLEKAIEENPHTRVTVLYDPEFELYRRDPDFQKLVKV